MVATSIIITSVTHGDILRKTCNSLPATASAIENHWGFNTGRRQFCRVGTQMQKHWLFLLAGSFVTQPQDSTYPIIFYCIQLFSQVHSLWPEHFCASKTFAAAASALGCKRKPKSPVFFLFSFGDSKGKLFLLFFFLITIENLLYLNKTGKFGLLQ